jgi:hypothetical protein
MTATPHPEPDPLAALPLLAEAGVSVYWQPLEGRTAWVADVETRQVWLSRSIPRRAVLGCLIEALQVLDEGAEEGSEEGPDTAADEARASGPRLVHSADTVEQSSPRTPALHVVGGERPGTG